MNTQPLVVVIDMDRRAAGHVSNVLEAVTVYVTAIGMSLAYPGRMEIAVIAAFPEKASFVMSGDWRAISCLRDKLTHMCTSRLDAESELETPIAQGVSRALCFVQKHAKTGKIILFEHSVDSTDFSSQSVALSNCGWAAAGKARVHVVSLGSATPSSAVMSLCFKTGGAHIPFKHTQSLGELTQAMLFHLTATETVLPQLKVRPEQSTQHMGTVCVCHNKSLDRGYVCSICLSIFCVETAGICAVCGSRIRREAKDEQPVSAQIFTKLFGNTSNSIFPSF